MDLLSSVRRIAVPMTAIALALSGSLVPATSVLAAVTNPAGGGTRISADEFGTANYTPLTGPAIAESTAGELTLGSTTVLNIPAGFQFHAGIGTLGVSGAGCDLKGSLVVTATQATVTVTHASTVTGCFFMFVGLEVQPTAGGGLTTGNITKTGTSAAPGGATNYGTLTKVAGRSKQVIYVTQPSATNFGGNAFGTEPAILVRDQFGNPVAGTRVTLSITPGTGPTGASLTCSTNPVGTNSSGVADFTAANCRINKAGTYRLRATNGTPRVDSGTFQVKVGPATRIVFVAYPSSTTKALLAAQPRVAIVDAGGNVVTTYPATRITIAINKHATHFTCTGGLTATTVNGIATFHGCKQTYVTTLYRLTAWTGFASVLGGLFRVVS